VAAAVTAAAGHGCTAVRLFSGFLQQMHDVLCNVVAAAGCQLWRLAAAVQGDHLLLVPSNQLLPLLLLMMMFACTLFQGKVTTAARQSKGIMGMFGNPHKKIFKVIVAALLL
jgi:hypothetical protein